MILIRAWCCYESRTLGARYGLISDYALEILVLYIFQCFHSSLEGPLEVLYEFADFYGKYDWDNYIISLHGSISLAFLPEIVVEIPKSDESELLFNKDFLNSMRFFSRSYKRGENNSLEFMKKYLNIMDPIRENNNLGCCITRGKFYRIRSAFAYGARNLRQILLLPEVSFANKLDLFFKNTLEMHENGERYDV
ncbi:hypothetical protein DsansV1_C17g0145441 [Dioscorea sansibarensis]